MIKLNNNPEAALEEFRSVEEVLAINGETE